jgi:transcriptional regulator with XRE-family HTH domain
MDSTAFKAWRKSLGLRQKEAAEMLGLKKRMIQYYETGRRGSKKVVIPKTVELACYALSLGVEAFDGAPPATNDAFPDTTDAPGDKKARLSQEAA